MGLFKPANCAKINSLLKKPENGGKPDKAAAAMIMQIMGIFRRTAALSADVKHVVGVIGMDKNPGAKEQQGLESGMGGQVKYPGK